MRYFIHTYGCQMNVHESEKLAGCLQNLGYNESDNVSDADVVVFNTCAIREGAQHKIFGNIGALKKLKKENPNMVVAVCGCMTQQSHVADEIYQKFKFVDIVFGTHNIHEFENYLKHHQQDHKRQLNKANDSDYIWENFPVYRTSGENAWVNIMYGCNNFCTYCIVPYVRGREKSRKKENILDEIKQLISTNKYSTITLLGQNVNSYGKTLYQNYGFAQLLQDICKLEGNFKVTFMTSHPKDISDELLQTMANEDKIIKYLHLPVQSGSNKILSAMNRKYSIEKYYDIIKKAKSIMPNISLSSDFIVGFPGETDEDFEMTKKVLTTVKYDNIFAFMYSKRPGTVAEKMENQVADSVKHVRVNQLLELQKAIKRGEI